MQRFFMVYVYYQTDGANWIKNDLGECNRNSSLAVGGWYEGIEPYPICEEGNRVLALTVSSNNLRGKTPSDGICFTSTLNLLDVSTTSIS